MSDLFSVDDKNFQNSFIPDMRHTQQFHRKPYVPKSNNPDYEITGTFNEDDQYTPNLSYRMLNNSASDSLIDYLSDDESDTETPNGMMLDIVTPVRDVVCKMLDNYLADEKTTADIEFPSSLFCHERVFIRQQAQQRNLLCRTLGRGASRVVVVSKSTDDSTSQLKQNSNKQLTFALNNAQLLAEINNYLQLCPVTNEDNELLQAKIQKTPSSLNDWFYCTLLRSGNSLAKNSEMRPRVPDRRFLSREYANVILPIDKTTAFENLLHLLENNKILFINGPPAIGKSIRICQYIHDDHYDKQWPIRILHSCTTSLGAYALSAMLSFYHQSIDCFTFDNMSSTMELNSLITVTTHEFLLHTLISGDSLLKSSITHLILDDVHKRSHTLDMLLAYLKDTQQKFRHLKLVLLQTILPYDTLVKYFGNAATYNIDINGIIIDDIEEIFLDRVLTEIQGIDQTRCLSIENHGVQLLNHWCRLAEQSSIQHQMSQSVIPDFCRNIYSALEQTMSREEQYLNDLLARSFCFGLIEDLQKLTNFILNNPEKCNYQHPLTLVTPLICLTMWSMKPLLLRLLSLEVISIDLRAVNNFSAIDFARKYATNDTMDFLENSFKPDPLLLEQLLSLTNPNSHEILSPATMKFYLQSRPSDSVIDYQLILSVIRYVYPQRTDHIIVFLPGPHEISMMNDLFLKFNLLHKLDLHVYSMIDSSSPWPRLSDTRTRLLIFCDGNCETGLPFLSIGCVIDTGIILEKCSHASTSKLLPKYNWINQTSATERKYRANRTGGICYRLYPHYLFDEKINENVNAEMARQPLLENIMQAKLFAWTSCSVAEFMLKLPFPPPFATVRAGITQLKNLDLFDKWEDLVDLGAYCLALPVVELPYAMMIVYAHLFKCLEPILILTSALTIGDPFHSFSSNHRQLLELKQQLSLDRVSDHFLLYQIYEKWKKSSEKEKFSLQWKLKYFRMEQIDRFKTWLTSFLLNINYVNFFYSNSEESIDLNENSSCWLLIEAILVRCLPQNVIIYDQQWSSIRNEPIQLDRSSIVHQCSAEEQNISFAICDDLIRTNKGLFIGKYVTIVDPFVLLFFGTNSEPLKLNIYELNFTEKNFIQLRTKLHACLRRKLQSLGCDNFLTNNCHSIHLLVKIFSDRK